jgi:hypothetical protein
MIELQLANFSLTQQGFAGIAQTQKYQSPFDVKRQVDTSRDWDKSFAKFVG